MFNHPLVIVVSGSQPKQLGNIRTLFSPPPLYLQALMQPSRLALSRIGTTCLFPIKDRAVTMSRWQPMDEFLGRPGRPHQTQQQHTYLHTWIRRVDSSPLLLSPLSPLLLLLVSLSPPGELAMSCAPSTTVSCMTGMPPKCLRSDKKEGASYEPEIVDWGLRAESEGGGEPRNKGAQEVTQTLNYLVGRSFDRSIVQSFSRSIVQSFNR